MTPSVAAAAPPPAARAADRSRMLPRSAELGRPSPRWKREVRARHFLPLRRLLPAQGLAGGPRGAHPSSPRFGAGSQALPAAASPASPPPEPHTARVSPPRAGGLCPSQAGALPTSKRWHRKAFQASLSRTGPAASFLLPPALPRDELSQGSAGRDGQANAPARRTGR